MDNTTVKTLSDLETTADKFWNVSRQSANFINMLIKLMNAQNVLEIGTSNGYSGLWIADALKETGGHLTTIEFWEKRQCIARENFQKCGLGDIITCKIGDACEVIKNEISAQFDLVFIDANKGEYVQYFEAVHPFVKKGGVILADNITSHAGKVQPFIDAITDIGCYQVQVLDLPDGMLMGYKYKEQ